MRVEKKIFVISKKGIETGCIIGDVKVYPGWDPQAISDTPENREEIAHYKRQGLITELASDKVKATIKMLEGKRKRGKAKKKKK